MRDRWRAIPVLALMLSLSLHLGAQVTNTLYFMQGVPQSNRINPALQPDGGLYLGLPGASPLTSELSTSSISWGDVIFPHPSEDSLITFLHPLADNADFLQKLKPLNYVISDVGTSLISLGFRTGAGYFSLDITSRLEGNIYIPGDLARLAIEGANEGITYELDGIGADLTAFEEISLGWSYELGQNMEIGVRGKLLFGIGDLTTSKSQMSLTTSEEVWNLRSSMLFDASLPFAEVVYDDEGLVEDILIDEDLENLSTATLARYAFNQNNLGAAIDLGINYRPGDRWLISASLLDLGMIRWKDNVHQASYEIEYDYTSVDVDPLDFADDLDVDTYADSVLNALADTPDGRTDHGTRWGLQHPAQYQTLPGGILLRDTQYQFRAAFPHGFSAGCRCGTAYGICQFQGGTFPEFQPQLFLYQ
jgi:hypothetical protein